MESLNFASPSRILFFVGSAVVMYGVIIFSCVLSIEPFGIVQIIQMLCMVVHPCVVQNESSNILGSWKAI